MQQAATSGATPPRFDDASREVLTYLRDAFPIGTWAVTRFDGERQVYLTVDDTDLGVTSGVTLPWADTMCQHLTPDGGPLVARDLHAVPEYAAIVDRSGAAANAYVGAPLVTSDGVMFGSLCGFGRDRLADDADTHTALVALLAQLLSNILEGDLHATAVARALEAAERRADTDALTGLVGRRGWEKLLAAEDDRFRRFGVPGAVVVIDLDDLKQVNDTQGHHAGDDHLRRVADLLVDEIDIPATIARIGGDEYAVLISEVPPTEVDHHVGALRRTLARRGLSASMGVGTHHPSDGLDGAWRRADAAMYREKMARRAGGEARDSRTADSA